MKSAFGSKRKARKIQVDEDEEDGAKDLQLVESVNTRKHLKSFHSYEAS